jgi:hypothetical protein
MAPALPFQGSAFGLSSAGLSKISGQLAVHVPEIWAVLTVETSGCGFLPDRRPQTLFERHIFHRLTGGRFDDGDISDASPGGYGARGAQQYDRLGRAILKDRSAALQSTSWGIGQIMGQNHALAGFETVDEMVLAMSRSEDDQLMAMAAFLVNAHLAASLQAHDWSSFARGYNGPNYVINRYDVRLNGEYQKYLAGGLPDLNVRAAQLYLTFLNLHPGPIDGIAGVETLAAFSEFARQHRVPDHGVIDAAAVTNLIAALPSLA